MIQLLCTYIYGMAELHVYRFLWSKFPGFQICWSKFFDFQTESGKMEIWKYSPNKPGNLEIQKSGNLDISTSGDLETWKFSQTNWKSRKLSPLTWDVCLVIVILQKRTTI